MTFKEKVCETIIQSAQLYKHNYVDYQYLLYSEGFRLKKYYIISADEDNFKHLTGVNTSLTPKEFYNKSLSGTLNVSDFDFIKEHQTEKSVKGSVRRKINILADMMTLMDKDICAEEGFRKNKIFCSLATTDGSLTLGLVDTGTLRPRTLLKGNELSNSVHISLILKCCKKAEKFDTIVKGSINKSVIEDVCDLLAQNLLPDNPKKLTCF